MIDNNDRIGHPIRIPVGPIRTPPNDGPPSGASSPSGPTGSVGTGGDIPPSQVTSPVNPPSSSLRGNAWAVIVNVDNANAPRYCTIAVDNKEPFESGYLLPTGVGPFAAGGTAGFNYFYNNSSGTGGSIVNVDLDARMIIGFTGDSSSSAPTPFYKAITDHQHSGNLNPDGYTNPAPVDLSSGQSVNPLPYTQHALPIQSVINNTGKILSTVINGAMVDSDGAMVNAHQKPTKASYSFNTSQAVTISAKILNGQPGIQNTGIILGDANNGYGLLWDTGNHAYIGTWVNGRFTALTPIASMTQDNGYHHYRLTIVVGSPNYIDGSLDNTYFSTFSDSSHNLISQSWTVQTYTG